MDKKKRECGRHRDGRTPGFYQIQEKLLKTKFYVFFHFAISRSRSSILRTLSSMT